MTSGEERDVLDNHPEEAEPELDFRGVPMNDIQEWQVLNEELSRRSLEALHLYEPSEFQLGFHQADCKQKAIIAGNQVGKSLAAFVEDCWAVTGQHPFIEYPKKNGVLVCVGLDETHIGTNIYRYLFRPGAFKIIKDPETGQWRTWRPWDNWDLEHRELAEDAPPLIPERFIKHIAWKRAGQRIFNRVELTNGWLILAFGSKSEPAAGFQADIYHFDEDIDRVDWYSEAIARLSMRRGRILWSALPLVRNEALMSLVEEGESQERDLEAIRDREPDAPDDRTVRIFRATIFDNPYMPEETKRENVAAWKRMGDDEYRKRALGDPNVESLLMYPAYSDQVHTAFPDRAEGELEIFRILRERNGEPPSEWTRYLAFDPGFSVSAVEFVAVPPPALGDFKICYDEIYLRNIDIDVWGKQLEPKIKGWEFEEFIIDAHGGRIRSVVGGELPQRQYERRLQELGLECAKRGPRFVAGSDDVDGRVLKLRSWLSIRGGEGLESGYPTVLFCHSRSRSRVHNLVSEIKRFKKKVVNVAGTWVPSDEGNRRVNTHAVECLEYLAAHGCPYVEPRTDLRSSTTMQRIIAARRERARIRRLRKSMRGGGDFVNLGPLGDGG